MGEAQIQLGNGFAPFDMPRYLERVYNIQRWTVFPRGGHFAPAEEPAALAGDLTVFFRDLLPGRYRLYEYQN